MPMRFTGHISSNSLFFVRSPRWIVRNFPKVIYVPTDCGSSALFSPALKLAQYGFRDPAPGNGFLITWPADVTIRASNPVMAILSPGFATVCLPFATIGG